MPARPITTVSRFNRGDIARLPLGLANPAAEDARSTGAGSIVSRMFSKRPRVFVIDIHCPSRVRRHAHERHVRVYLVFGAQVPSGYGYDVDDTRSDVRRSTLDSR